MAVATRPRFVSAYESTAPAGVPAIWTIPFGNSVTETIGTSPGSTKTVARAVEVKPDPVALSVYSVVVDGVTVSEPEVATDPTAWSIETAVASVVVHVSVDACPFSMKLGSALKLMDGPGELTEIETVRCALPAGPVAVSVKVVESCNETSRDPLSGTAPIPLSISTAVAFCVAQV